MKPWIPNPDGSIDWRRAVLHKLGGFAARLLLFGSVFLIHSGERCASDIGRPPVRSEGALSEVAPQPIAGAAPIPRDDLPLAF